MPIYEYRCSICRKNVEVLISSPEATARCPECDRVLTERLFSAPNIGSTVIRRAPGHTCCGREERCEAPPCDTGAPCHRE